MKLKSLLIVVLVMGLSDIALAQGRPGDDTKLDETARLQAGQKAYEAAHSAPAPTETAHADAGGDPASELMQEFIDCAAVYAANADVEGNTLGDQDVAAQMLEGADEMQRAATYYAKAVPGVTDPEKYVADKIMADVPMWKDTIMDEQNPDAVQKVERQNTKCQLDEAAKENALKAMEQ